MSYASSGREMSITLTAIDNASGALRAATGALGEYRTGLERTVSAITSLGPAAIPILAIGAAFTYVGQQAATVQQNVANLNSVLHATNDQLAAIRNNGLALSQATQFTDAQILQAQRQLAKGGATADSLAQYGPQGITGATLNLAGATQQSPTDAATAITTAQTAFGLGSADAARSASTLAAAVDTSVGTLNTQANALKQVGTVARAAGFDLKDTVTAIADLQNAGLQSDAGTSLKTFISRIESPTAAARQEINALGLSFYDLQGNLKPIPQLFQEIHDKTMGMTDETANAALFKIFGQRGVRVADIAMEQGGGGIIDQARREADIGDAAEINARKLDTFQGSASKAASSLNVLAVQMGMVLLPAMKGSAEGIQGVANALSSLDQHAAVIPQLLVAGAAIGGEALLQRNIGQRAGAGDRQAQEAADREDAARQQRAETMRVQAAAEQERAMRGALVTRNFAGIDTAATQQEKTDQARLASGANVAKAQATYDEQVLASGEKTATALAAADSQYTSQRMSNLAKLRAAVADLQQAEQERAEKTMALQDIQMRQEAAALEIRQQFAHQRLDLSAVQAGGAGAGEEAHQQLSERQALDREQATTLAASRAQFDAERAGVQMGSSEKVIAATRASYANERNALLDEYRKNRAALEEGSVTELDGMRTAYQAKLGEIALEERGTIEAINARAAAETAAQQTAYERTALRAQGNFDQRMGTADSVAAGRTGIAVSSGTSVTVDETTKSTIGSRIGGILGRVAVPILMAVTVKDLVLAPVAQGIIDREVGLDKNIAELHVQARAVIDDKSGDYTKIEAAIKDEREKIQSEIKKQEEIIKNDPQSWMQNVPFVGGLAAKAGGDDAATAVAKKQIASLKQDLTDLDQQGKKTDLLPQQAMQSASDRLDTIVGKVDAGNISLEQARLQWLGLIVGMDSTEQMMRKAGLSQEDVNKKISDGTALIQQHVKALQDKNEQDEADFQRNAQTAMRQMGMGASEDVIAVANFGKHLDQTDATKAEVQAAKQELSDLEQAWTKAQSVVNSIDISKGFDAFGKLADNIRIANQELARAGQSNPALQNLGQMSQMFADVLAVEKQATQGLEGYNLTLQKTEGYLSQVDKVQKDFDTALEAAERRQAAGRATAADQQLINNRGNIAGALDNQRQQLSEHMVLDVLGEVQNLPDFAALDNYVRDVIEKAGGGIKVVATVDAETTDARRDIEDILKPRDLHVTVIPDFTQFDSAMAERAKRYVVNSPYNDQPPGSAGGGFTQPAGSYGGVENVPGYANAQVGSPGGLNYRAITPQQVQQIIESGGGKGGPMDNPETINSLIRASQEQNVDPRAILATLQFEGNYGAKTSRQNVSAHNLGGIKFDDQPGATRGGRSPEHDDYAAFGSDDDFYAAIARNLSTRQYEKDYKSGNFAAIREEYVTGGAVPTKEQSQNIQSTVDLYNRLNRDYPANARANDYNYGQGGNTDDQGVNVSGQDIDSTASSVRQKIVQTALSQIDINKLVAYCEQFVEETVQAATGKRGATGIREPTASAAFAQGQQMGLETKNPQPGDLVYYPDASGGTGHVAIYMGTNAQGVPQQVSTWDKGAFPGNTGPNHSAPGNPANARIHLEDVGSGARYLSVTAGGYGPDPLENEKGTGGTVLANDPSYLYNRNRLGASTSQNVPTQNALGYNGQTPIPVRIYPDEAAKSLPGFRAQMGNLDLRGQGEVQSFMDRVQPVLTTLEQNKMGFGPGGTLGKPNAADTEKIDNAGLKDSLDLATAYGAAIENINKGLAVTPDQWDAINKAAGPLAPLIDAEVAATANLEMHTQNLARLKQEQQDADTAHQAVVEKRQQQDQSEQRTQTRQQWSRADAEEQIQNQRRVISEGEQDFDRARQRKNSLEQRDIEDARTAEQRQWQDEQQNQQNLIRAMQEGARQQDLADQSHKNTLDDAYQLQSRTFQDQQRLLEFRGGQDSITLQDQKKALDEQHRLSTQGMQQTSGLYVGLGKASGTEAEATNYASLAAAVNDARLKADDLYKKQSDANQRSQDALAKTHAQEMYDLETARLAIQRKYDDEVKGIDRAAQTRHNTLTQELYDMQVEQEAEQIQHQTIMRNEEDQDKARQRSFEDESFNIETTRIAEQRRWKDEDTRRQDAQKDEDRNYQTKKWQDQDIATDQDNAYKNAKLQNQQQQQDEQANITAIGKQISGIDLVISKYDTLLKMFGDAANKALSVPSVDPNPASTNPKGFAVGSGSTPAGLAFVNERGGELRVLGSGETIIPADQTKRMFDAFLRPQNVSPISAAPSYQEGNITINMGDSEVALSSSAQARIRAIIRQEVADSQPTTYSDVRAATGGIRKA